MNELIYSGTYQSYKAELDAELQKTAESFVRIGYLLKVARDTSILAESGYKSVTDFAQAEYGIDKSQVSRFIRINDRFAEGGYSERLQDQYQGFGFSKLSLMLQLPDSVNEELTPDFTKTQITELKEEVQKAQEDTPLQVYAEQLEEAGQEEDIVTKAVRAFAEGNKDITLAIHTAGEETNPLDWMLHDEVAQYSFRVSGQGRMSLILKKDSIRLVNLRTDEKWTFTEAELKEGFRKIGTWQQSFEEEFYGPKEDPMNPPEEPERPKVTDLSKVGSVEELRKAETTGNEANLKEAEKPQKIVPEMVETEPEPEKEPEKPAEEPVQIADEPSVDRQPEVVEVKGYNVGELEYYETKIRLMQEAFRERRWSKLRHMAQDVMLWAEKQEDIE